MKIIPTTDKILTAGVLGLFIIFFFFLFMKWWFPFWSSQPIFHSYDLWRYFCIQPFYIHKQYRPLKKKNQSNQNNLQFISKKMLDCSPNQNSRLLDFIHCFYIPAENSLFYIPSIAFHSIFISSTLPSITTFILQQKTNEVVIDDDNQQTNKNKIIGCLTSCSVQLQIQTQQTLFSSSTLFQQNIYHLYYLSISTEKKQCELTQQLLQEHLNIQNQQQTTASFFWKEGEPCHGIVAFLTTTNFLIDFKNVKILPKLPSFYNLSTAITHDDLNVIIAVSQNNKQFTCSISPNKAQTMARIKSGLLHIYLLKFKGDVCGVYIFKDCFTILEINDNKPEKHCLELQGCWLGNQNVANLSSSVIKHVVYEWVKQKKNDIDDINGQSVLLKINTTAHNQQIIQSCNINHDICIIKSHISFGYFHNLFCRQLETTECFIWG